MRMSKQGEGDIVFVSQDVPDDEEGKGTIKSAAIMMQDENHGIVAHVKTASARATGRYGYGWDGNMISGKLWLDFEFSHERGIDRYLYLFLPQLGLDMIRATLSRLS